MLENTMKSLTTAGSDYSNSDKERRVVLRKTVMSLKIMELMLSITLANK